MKSIRIFDKDINLLGEIDKFSEFKLIRRFFSLDEFELKLDANTIHSDKLVLNNLVVLNKDYTKVGIILHREFEGDNKSNILFIKGYTLKGLTHRKMIIPDVNSDYESCIGRQETILKHFVNKNCVNPINPKRKTGRLVIAEDKLRGNDDAWRSSYENLADKLGEIGEYCGLGWNIVLDKDKKEFVFDVLEGRDLTVEQNINPPVIFRSDFNNLKKRHFIESLINTSNVIYVGEKEDSTNLVLSVGFVEGFERIETFHTQKSDNIDELIQVGNVKLKELEEIKTFEIEVNPNKNFIYEKDYNLGDIATVQDRKLKITMNARIIEAEEYYTKAGMSIKLTFGNSIPNILTKVNKIERRVR